MQASLALRCDAALPSFLFGAFTKMSAPLYPKPLNDLELGIFVGDGKGDGVGG